VLLACRRWGYLKHSELSWVLAYNPYFGKGGEMASNRADDKEISMHSLHLLQLSLVYVNTLMIQQVLAEQDWHNRLNTDDLRGITPLLYSHVNPYGSFRLDINSRLPIDPPVSAHNPSAPSSYSAMTNTQAHRLPGNSSVNVGFGPIFEGEPGLGNICRRHTIILSKS